MSDQQTTQSYNEAYRQLKNGVEQLRRTDIANMDDLVPLVEQTTVAYQVCKKRLDAVEALIKDALGRADSSNESED